MSNSNPTATSANPINSSSESSVSVNAYDDSLNELDLVDVINFLRRNFKKMLIGALLGLAIGGLLVVWSP